MFNVLHKQFLIIVVLSFQSLCLNQKNGRVEFSAAKDSKSPKKVFEFANLVVDEKRNGDIYLGGRNHLYQLNNDLINRSGPVLTGPLRDDIVCKCKRPQELTDNLNKLLLIDYYNNRIIICGSVEQGICELRQLGYLQRRLSNYNISDVSLSQHVAAPGNLSTVGFLVTLDSNEEYMFVGSSKTHYDVQNFVGYTTFNTIAKHSIPVDSLSKDMFSSEVKTNFVSFYGIKMKRDYSKKRYRVTFVDGFSHDKTGYFVTTHPFSSSDLNHNNDATYLGQICLEDNFKMNSYHELPLECSDRGIIYQRAVASDTSIVGTLLERNLNLSHTHPMSSKVVFISFVRDNGIPGSAVCMFPLKEIEKRFVKVIRRCMKGYSGQKPGYVPWISNEDTNSCGRGSFEVVEPICKSTKQMWQVIYHLEANTYTANAVYKTDDSIVTAIKVVLTEDNAHTVGFFGTDNGYLRKVRLNSASNNNPEFEEIPINPFSSASGVDKSYSEVKKIERGPTNDVKIQRIFVMTPSLLVGEPLFHCYQYTTCENCSKSMDPFCGWCTLEAKCTSAGECTRANSSDPFHFIESGGQCPRLTSNDRRAITASQSQVKVDLIGSNIPYLEGKYYCEFGNIYRHSVTAISKKNINAQSLLNIQCVSPPKGRIPPFTAGKGDLTMPLSLIHGAGKDAKIIATTNFTFYNCSFYSSCMSCVNSPFNCSWCLGDNECRFQSATYCPQSNVKQSNSCPQLALPHRSDKVYLPTDLRTNLELDARNVLMTWKSFSCEIDYGDGRGVRSYDGEAINGGTKILCKGVKGSLPVNLRQAQAAVAVTTEGTRRKIVIDNPRNLAIEVYRCGFGDDANCGECLQSPSEWKCGWCEGASQCTLLDLCSGKWFKNSNQGLCRNPQILSFQPQTAPFDGSSTVVSLKGTNFAPKGHMRITVSGTECIIINSSCCEATCQTNSYKTSSSGRVNLCIMDDNNCRQGSDYLAHSSKSFSFVDPTIDSFSPRSNLRGWGAVVTLNGKHLDTGNAALVSVDGAPCAVQKRTYSTLQCRLNCSNKVNKRDTAMSRVKRYSSKNGLVEAVFDGVNRVAKSGKFVFEESATIGSVDPPCSIRSGGLPLIIHGSNLHLISDPLMQVEFDGQNYIQKCKKLEERYITCTSPNVSSSPFFKDKDLDFEATGVIAIYNQGCDTQFLRHEGYLKFGPDPHLETFEGEKQTKLFRDEPLYITGKNLCPDEYHCDSTNVKVLIGSKIACNVTRLDITQITCLPNVPDLEGRYPVQVTIGGYSQYVGSLDYVHDKGFPLYGIILLIVGILLIFFIIGAVLCIYRKQAKESDMQLQNVQRQMNLMDAKVAQICKEGFAELQTDMCHLDTQGRGSIPFLSYPVYLMRVLFPDPSTAELQQSLLKSPDTYSDRRPVYGRPRASMDTFDQLLGNKIFLLCLIKTLENQQTFLVKDRAKVAGLIMIILHNRLQYATEILENLLADLIHKNMESRNHPKLLLRRTESVAEKLLTHWFSILLYGFVEECAGDPLYTLFRAIKQQVEKGPLDAFTNEARYSLSEDKLLRQTVQHEVIQLQVLNYLTTYDDNELTVKVLSCDSISQVKSKLLDAAFVGVHYSERPHPEDVDLEVVQDKLLPLILHDEDHSSETEAEWKKINTLAHYNIKNGDQVSIIPRKEPSVSNYSVGTTQSKASLLKSNGTGTSFPKIFYPGESTTSSLSRLKQGMGTLTLPHNHTKMYHLVKPSDQDQTEGPDRGSKMVSEVYLTRLLITKGTIQKYVDDLFETIFSTVQRGHDLPLAVKHMFDFLDHQADIHDITDPDVVHTWKSNCLPLRFWVNLIKNPEFIYDIDKTSIVDCYLSVIAQAFMDSCSSAEYKLGKDSPSNKLLYAKEIPEYRLWVKRYYSDISSRGQLNPRDLAAFLQRESTKHGHVFERSAALSQLFIYVQKYGNEILTQLDIDAEGHRQHLTQQLDNLLKNATTRT